jgi:hypothetical protein
VIVVAIALINAYAELFTDESGNYIWRHSFDNFIKNDPEVRFPEI